MLPYYFLLRKERKPLLEGPASFPEEVEPEVEAVEAVKDVEEDEEPFNSILSAKFSSP